jgi:hypothetical protein
MDYLNKWFIIEQYLKLAEIKKTYILERITIIDNNF